MIYHTWMLWDTYNTGFIHQKRSLLVHLCQKNASDSCRFQTPSVNVWQEIFFFPTFDANVFRMGFFGDPRGPSTWEFPSLRVPLRQWCFQDTRILCRRTLLEVFAHGSIWMMKTYTYVIQKHVVLEPTYKKWWLDFQGLYMLYIYFIFIKNILRYLECSL